MKFFKFCFLAILLSASGITYAKGETYGEYLATVKDIPSFEEFKTDVEKTEKHEELKLAKQDKAWMYRTRLREAYKDQPDFAGKYVIATIGCGTYCQTNFILNKENGEIIGNLSSSIGVDYKLDSRLIIVNSPKGYEDVPADEMPAYASPSYYELKNNKLVLIKEVNKDITKKAE